MDTVDPSLAVVGQTNQVVDYQLCQPFTIKYTLAIFNGYINDLSFDLVKYDNTLTVNSVSFAYKHGSSAEVPFLNPVYSTTSGLTTTFYMQDQLTPFYYPGYLASQDKIIMTVEFTPTQRWTSIPLSSPFGLDYHYTTYCGDPGSSQQRSELDGYNFIPGGCTLLNVQTIPNILTCASSNTQITTNVSSGTPGYTYAWTTNPAGANPTGPNPVVSPAVTTFYTVIVTDANGVTGSSTTLIQVMPALNCCVPVSFDITTDLNYSGISSSSLPYNRIHTLNQILINGQFTVDQDFAFDNCTNIVLGPGATIVVGNGITLEMFDSHIYSCDEMSEGIVAMANSTIRMTGSKIEDAHYGINLSDGCNVISTNSFFWNNFVGINCTPGIGSVSPVQITTSISGTDFATTRNLVPKYTGLLDLPLTHGLAYPSGEPHV